jgi:hypothetical protein
MSWLPRRLRGERDTAMWVALGLALILSIQPDDSGAVRLTVIGGLFLAFLAARWLRLGWWGIAILLIAGMSLRLGVWNHRASDVLDVTSDAVRLALLGLNPWGHGYEISRPPGAPFPYGPLEILWYSPGVGDPRQLELFVSMAVLALFAVRGRPVGLAVYALAPTIILTSSDGSNDTSAGLLILAALAVAAKRPWVGAGILALAVAFKLYALAWLPALLAFGGAPALAAFVGVSALAWAPAFYAWGVDNFLVSLQLADQAHRLAYWSIGVIYEDITQRYAPHALLDQIRLVVAVVVTLGGLIVAKSIDRVIAVGTIIFIIVMFGGFWGSYAYLGAIAPILCWRLDDWLRLPVPEHVKDLPWAPQPPDEAIAEPAAPSAGMPKLEPAFFESRVPGP